MTDSDDENLNDPGVVESASGDEERPQCGISTPVSDFYLCSTLLVERLSSSIHTIHRPLARSNRRNIPIPSKPPARRNEEDLLEDISPSDDEIESDFEETSSPDAPSSQIQQTGRMSPKVSVSRNSLVLRERAGSIATIRLHRRSRLAEKLKEVYDLEDVREVWAGTS